MQMKREFLECSMSWAQIRAISVDRHLKVLKAYWMSESYLGIDLSEQMAALFVG